MKVRPPSIKTIALVSATSGILLCAAAAGIWLSRDRGADEPVATVSFELAGGGWLNVTCEVADTPDERARGLMDRESLAADGGMIFDYDPPQNVTFWMKDTLIPLDIIFINGSGHVVGVAEADVEAGVSDNQLTRYPSPGPVRWVVEVNQGVCASNGIGAGSRVDVEWGGEG